MMIINVLRERAQRWRREASDKLRAARRYTNNGCPGLAILERAEATILNRNAAELERLAELAQ